MIMELDDSIGGDRNHNVPAPAQHYNDLNNSNNQQDSRSVLGIDLNEIPSPSSETLFDSAVDIVRAYHENPAPPPGGPAVLPDGLPCAVCANPRGGGDSFLVCDGCERGFHLACAGIRGRHAATSFVEWVCGDCMAGGVKSKRWPLGVKSKQLLDMNASPPSDAEGEESQDLRKHTLGDTSFGANQFGASGTYSNFYSGSLFGFQRASGVVTHAVRVGIEDILNHTQALSRSFEEVHRDFPLGVHSTSNNTAVRILPRSPNEIFLQALRDFISERCGVLEEGWQVEFRQSVNSSDLYAVYCAPDGKIFDSVYEVACYLGLTSGYNSIESERSIPSLSVPHLPRKKMSARTLVANGFAEKPGTLMNINCKDSSSDGLSVECAGAQGTVQKLTEIGRKEDDHSNPHQSSDALPLQFKDFYVLSLGKVAGRCSYYDVNLIFPLGYESCWHDKITGSLFTCEVLDGGDSGPIFRIRRRSCSEFPVPVGSTILSMSSLCQFVSQTKEEIERKADMDFDSDESIQMMLLDTCAPTVNDILYCVASFSDEACTSDGVHPVVGTVQDNTRNSSAENMRFSDEIGEILVEERSSLSAWRVISQKLVTACMDICKRKGSLKFYCKHVESETGSHNWDLRNGKCDPHFASLDKFCGYLGSVSIPNVVYANNDLKGLCELLGKWLEQDRFGLDAEFVQEVLEQLPGVKDSLQYELLSSRTNSSSLPTVENGFLAVEYRGQLKYQDEEAVQGLYKRPKKASLTENPVKEDRCPPPGKPLCSMVPSEFIGDILQVSELLYRFHEILDLKEPPSLEELEKEIINPWFDELDFPKNFEREINGSQVLSSQGGDGDCQPICEAGPPASVESAFIQVETEAMKEAAQVKLASFTYARCFGVALTKAHTSLLRVLIGELQSKVVALERPGEPRTRRGRRKDIDSAVPAKRIKVNMLPINELTWPELVRRYILSFLSMDGNLESAEATARESGKVLRCLQGDGGLLCGSLADVAGMEADALLLAEATKKIFGSMNRENDALIIEEEESDANGAFQKNAANDVSIPEWAQMLEPVRKLPTNVGTRIRKCVHDALEKNPPEWARIRLEHSISKEVYKGNASGPTKKAVLSVLTDVVTGLQPTPSKRRKKKIVISISDIIMKQCRIVLRRAAAADDSKKFCNLLGRNLTISGEKSKANCNFVGQKLTNSLDNDEVGLLGSPAMVARPLDFRTIDLRLASGAYGGSNEAFLEDVRELWNNVRVVFGDKPDLVELAEELSKNFESLYNEKVATYIQKFTEYAKAGCLSAEMINEVDDFIASTSEIPKAPWDEGVCKVCGIDRNDHTVLLCDTCDGEYHTYCLDPPLASIPEGNWYCPSCVEGKDATEDVTECTQVAGKRQSKKFQGEVNCLNLEALTHLLAVIEEKEYWEYSVGQRMFLLKFLCDELLNSCLIHQHLEQCAELSVELHQKMRALSVEWKNMKIKEDNLSTKAAKIDTIFQNTSGEVDLKEGFTSLCSSTGKCLVQPHTVADNPGGFGVSIDSLPSEDINKGKFRFSNIDKSISLANSDSDSQNMNFLEGQLRNVSMPVDSQCADQSPKSFPPSNHMPQETDGSGGAAHIQGNQQKCEGRDESTPVAAAYQQGQCVPVEVPQITLNESEPYHHELNSIKHAISLQQDSMTSIGAQLLKLSVRREFLGTDSIGRLYWTLSTPRGRSRIVVDASAVLQHGRGLSVSKDSAEMLGSMKDSPLMSQPMIALGNSSPWIAYETDAEIGELLCWLKDDDPKERQLKDSIMLGPKSRLPEFSNTQTECLVEDQGPISMSRNREKTLPNSLVTKATSLLEKKYGSFFQWDATEVLKKQSKKTRTTNDEKLYRCECLEPLWPSRKHCMYCHKTFLNDEFEGHNDGKCNAGLLALEKNKDKIGSSKGKGNLNCDPSQEKLRADAETSGTSINRCSNQSSRLIQFSKDSTCPFNFEDICSKFKTNDSNKELVREIGLIRSDGIPSLVPSEALSVNDYMPFITLKDSGGSASKASESQVSQGNTDGAGICHDNKSGLSTERLAANESCKAGKSNKSSFGEQRDGKFSFCSRASGGMGVDGCCVVPMSSLRPLVGKVSHILRHLKINLLDMDAAIPEIAVRPSKAQSERRQAWRAFVKSAQTIYEMIQAIITLEDMIKSEYLRNDWWYWSSFSAAAKSSTLPSLALRIYSLDSAIIYENMPNSSLTDNSGPLAKQKQVITVDVEKCRASRKSSRKRKELDS